MASEELPIEASVIEAAAEAIHRREWVEKGYGPWEKFLDKDRILGVAEAAIRAADEARGMKVERETEPVCSICEGNMLAGVPGSYEPEWFCPRHPHAALKHRGYRLVSDWQPVEQDR